jgi:hypothetical protein
MKTETIVYFKNGIGNFIEMTPAIKALCSMDKSGQVDICTDSNWCDSRIDALRDIWDKSPLIQTVIEYPHDSLPQRYKRWFYSKHTEGSEGLQVFINRAPMFGNQINWSQTLMHETDYYMALVRSIGYRGTTPDQEMPITEYDLPISIVKDKIIALCNGASGSQKKQKQWPYFSKLARALHYYYGEELSIINIGNGNELKDVPCNLNLVGQLSITETASVLKQVDLLVTSDTGLMHVADALKIPMIVLFGGTVVSKNSPLNRMATIARANLSCQPCQYTDRFLSCEHIRCLNNLTVGNVMAHIRKRLKDEHVADKR